MRILRVILLILLLIVIVIAVGGFAVFTDTTRGPLPQTAGAIDVDGLQAQVEILRDDWGVPHLYASNMHDLFFAQGFTHAQDRWWQMEFSRHIGRGSIQELTGKNDSLLGTDVFIRTVGWLQAAQRDYEVLTEETRSYLQAFADGVNAYILNRPADDLALEYRLLGVTGVNIAIEPWSPLDSIVWGKVMAWNLTDSYSYDLARAELIDHLGQEMYEDYHPPFPFGQKPTIVQPEDLPLTAESLSTARAGSLAAMVVPSNRNVAGNVKPGSWISFGSDLGIGSNNWVATGTMTASGGALLANDPHLGIQMPSIWYEIGLHCYPVTDDCPLDVTGFALPAAPGVIIGHNASIAWGVTNVGADIQDLYAIQLNPDNPLQYQWNGEWRDITVREETIRFGDSEEPITIQVRDTHLGPIINDNQIDPDTGELLDFNSADPLVLRWTGHDAGTLFKSVMMLNLASDWGEFREALKYWTLPAQNFVYADVRGNIGYQMPGSIPIRPGHRDGLLPATAYTDDDVWQGYIPFDSLPRIYNPERDYIATANQPVVPLEFYEQLAAELGEENYYIFSYDWSYGYRGQRIVDMLQGIKPHSADSFRVIQGDNLNINAQEVLPYLTELAFEQQASAEARDFLSTWDFQNSIDSAQAGLYAQFSVRLLDNLFNDQLPEDLPASPGDLLPAALLMQDPMNTWWDDARTSDVAETRDDIIRRSFDEAVQAMVDRFGSSPADWRWGAMHTATFVSNPLGLSGIDLIEDMVNRGPVETSGGSEIVNATGWGIDYGADDEDTTFQVGSLPSMRMIVDLSDFGKSRTMHTTGQSGHPFSEHYDDMIDAWRYFDYHPMLWTRGQVENAADERLVLNPVGQ